MTRLPGRAGLALFIPLMMLSGVKFAASQEIEIVGSIETFELATWNIEWFGSPNNGPGDDDRQLANVHRIIEDSQIDLWAVQEISNPSRFEELLTTLGPTWDGRLAEITDQQRIGFLYNSATVRLTSVQHILEQFSTGQLPPTGQNYFASRAPLQLDVDVVLPDTTVHLTVITLHMKCCSDESSYDRRVLASDRLKNRIDYTSLNGEPVIVAGDYNDELSGSIRTGLDSPYANFLGDTQHFRFLTQTLDEEDIPTYCSSALCLSGSTLDHILITNELFPYYVEGSVGRLESAVNAIPGYANTTSDHLPVYAVFSFPTNTAVEEPPVVAGAISVLSLYPNPVRNSVNLEIETDGAAALSLTVFDVLGRVVSRHTIDRHGTGREIFLLSTMDLAPGAYLLSVESSSGSTQRTFLKAN